MEKNKNSVVIALLVVLALLYFASHTIFPIAMIGVLGAGLGIGSSILIVLAVVLCGLFAFCVLSASVSILVTLVLGILFFIGSILILPFLALAAPVLLVIYLVLVACGRS